jgi:tRNA pseudouridine55 synthase
MEKIAPEAYLDGQILLIDKPLKWSSFQAEVKICANKQSGAS